MVLSREVSREVSGKVFVKVSRGYPGRYLGRVQEVLREVNSIDFVGRQVIFLK
jgi:hypothetical protein